MANIKDSILDIFSEHERNQEVYFNKFDQIIQDYNKRVLNICHVLLPLLFIGMVAVSYYFQKSIDTMWILFLVIPIHLVYYSAFFIENKLKRLIDQDYYTIIYYVAFLIHMILVDTLAFKNSQGLWFHTFLILISLVYIARLQDYILLNIILGGLYGFLVYIFKNRDFLKIDIFNVIVSVIISVFIAVIVTIIRDSQAVLNQTLKNEGAYDNLTGLLNKGAAKKEIARYFENRPSDETVCVISLDADKFKDINDKLGHTAGDQVLSGYGDILKSHFRVDDIVARNGGDEFLVVMKGLVAPYNVDTICRRIQKSLADFHVEGGWSFTCSIGLVIDSCGYSFEKMFAMADDALYECKIRGRDCFTEWHTYQMTYDSSKPLILICSKRGYESINELFRSLRDSYSTLQSDNGNEVLNIASQYCNELSIVVLDMSVERIPAEQGLTYIKQRPNFSHIKVIAACPSPSMIVTARKLGADSIISLPSQPAKMRAEIERLLQV